MLSVQRMWARRPVSRSFRRAPAKELRPSLELLEARIVLYTASGNMWPQPQLITISFIPDGVSLGAGTTTNLFSTFNNPRNPKLTAQWQTQIIKAAQVWAERTNINFAVVPDNGAAPGSGNYEQGDPGFGDIRIGGYNFGSGNTALAMAYQPPPVNDFSLAGDIMFNTSKPFNIGSTYDLFTVAAHEFGHALGLDHSTTTSAAVMYANYNGIKCDLNPDDISGIRSIYGGARSPDSYNSGGSSNNSFATAASLNTLIDPTALTALVPKLDLNTVSQAEYFDFNAPTNTANGASLTLNVQSSGLSLLSPNVTVYAADQMTVLGSASGLNQYGTTLTVTVPSVYAGEQFYVKVQGADSSAFSTGNYAMTLNFGTGSSPTVPLPQTQTPNGNPITGGGGEADSLPGQGNVHHHFPHGPRIFGTRDHHGRLHF